MPPQDPFASIAQPTTPADPFASIAKPTGAGASASPVAPAPNAGLAPAVGAPPAKGILPAPVDQDRQPGGVFGPAGAYEASTGAGKTNKQQAAESLRDTGRAVAAVAPVVTMGASLPVQAAVAAGSGALGTKAEGGTNLQAIRNAAIAGAVPPAIEYGGQGLGKIVGAAREMFGGESPKNVLDLAPGSQAEGAPKSAVENPVSQGRYTPEGQAYTAAMRSNSHFDMPAEASRAIPALKESAADLGVNPDGDFQGMNGPALAKRINDHALEINEARNAAAIDPVRTQPADVSKTPELADLIGKKNPTTDDVDKFRIDGNKKLAKSGYYGQSPSQQYAAGPDLAKLEAAVSQARDVVYDSVYQHTGIDIRPSKQIEASLIKLNDVANSTNNTIAQQEAKYQSTPMSQRILGSVKRLVSIKANPTNAFEPGVSSPTDEFNGNMKRVFGDVKPAPGSVMKNEHLVEQAPGALTPPPGVTPPPVSTQGELGLEPNKPNFQLTPPAGTTPAAIQPRQAALPLTSAYAPMGEHAGLTSNIPGEAVPGQNLNLTGGNGINQPMQNILDFSKEAHPVPGPLKSALSEGGERRLAPRGNLSPEQILEGIKQRGQGPQTVVQNTEGAADLIKRSGVNNRGESMVYSDAGGEPRVTTLGGLNGSAKIGELVGKDIGNGTIEVTSNQIYGKNLQGVGRGTDQINHFLQNMGPETKIVKSDISTSVGARGAWDNVMKSNPGAVTKQVFKDGQVQYTVDMSKFARNR